MNPLLLTVVCGSVKLLGPIAMDQKFDTQGLFVCSLPTKDREVSFLTPPVRGKYMAQNANQIFEVYDFDATPEQKGMLWWKETIQKTSRAAVVLPVGESPNLPNVISLSSAQTGKQLAEVYYLPVSPSPILPEELTYSCQGKKQALGNGPHSAGTGVGACIYPAKASITLTVASKYVPAVVRLTGCGMEVVESVVDNSSPVSTNFAADDCELRVRILDKTGERNATLAFRTYPREDVLPKPVWTGKEWRWPFDATVSATEGNCGFAWSKESSSWRCK